MVLSGNSDPMINMIHHQGPSQKIHRKPLVLRSHLYQITGNPDNPRLFQDLRIIQRLFIVHTGKRQECSSSVFILLQKTDQLLGCLLIVCDNILDTASQSRLNGCLIFLFYFKNICHNAPDTRHPFFLFHDPADTVAVSVITFCNIPQGFQPGCLPVISSLTHFQLLVSSGYLCLIFLDLVLAPVSLADEFFNSFLDLFFLFPVFFPGILKFRRLAL